MFEIFRSFVPGNALPFITTNRSPTSGGYIKRTGFAAGSVVGGTEMVAFGSMGSGIVTDIGTGVVVGNVVLSIGIGVVALGRTVTVTVVSGIVRFIVVFSVVFVTTSPDIVESDKRTMQTKNTDKTAGRNRSLRLYLQEKDVLILFKYRLRAECY